jgi:pilus assembly protein Flp/PilA
MMLDSLRSFYFADQGGMAIEYGLIACLIAVSLLVAISGLGTDITELYTRVDQKVKDAPVPGGGLP